MNLSISKNGGQADVALSGSFTFSDTMLFKDIIALTEDRTIRTITLDFSAVKFIDSASLGMLMILRNNAEKNAQTIVLRRAMGQVEKIFRLSRFDSLFTMAS